MLRRPDLPGFTRFANGPTAFATAVLLCVAWSARPALAGPPPLPSHDPSRPVSFQNDVVAVLSKAGCNQGVCHGNKNGKGGLKLSLRGEDPRWDFGVLTREQSGRRINPVDPQRSLLLRKLC